MRIKHLLLLVTNAIVIVTVVTFSVTQYKTNKKALLGGIDEKLLTAASFAQALLPENYHNNIVSEHSVSIDDFDKIVDTNNKLCLKLDLQYIWSIMLIDNQIVFTTATSPSKSVENGDHAKFFEVHRDPHAFGEAFSTMKAHFSSFPNEWGHGRMVLIPKYDVKGRPYGFGASMSLSNVDSIIKKTIMNSILFGAGFILIGLFLCFGVSSLLSTPIIRLSRITANIAAGNLNQKVGGEKIFELRTLSKSIESMAIAVGDKIKEIEKKNKGFSKEVSERKLAEVAMQESEEKYRTMLDNIEDGYYEVDLEGNFTFFNESTCRILGYTANEMKGVNNRQYLDKKNAKRASEIHMNVLRTGKAHKSSDWEIIRKDGSEGFVEISITLIRDSKEQPVGFRGVARDVTDKKRLELQLQHAQKMESIGTLAGGIAHDFNNILGSIVLNSEMALDDIPENNDAKYSLEQVLHNSRRAKELVKHILTFSRLEEVARKPLKISIVVKESLKMLRSMFPSTIVIQQNIFADVGTIMADPTQIQQLVTNLCTNSLHAMKENGGTLSAELKNVKIDEASSSTDLKAGSYVKMTIKDSGHGIASENIARIFDPFFTTKQTGEGTGLGLSVVHGIVISNEGAIKVDSEQDKGTAFHVFFPIINDTLTPFHESDRSFPTGNERILFVDDEEALVDSSRRMLTRIGYTVVASNNGAEALELFQSNPDNFDLVITDTTMPNMTGVQLSEELLKICPDIPIIICTGHSDLITQGKLDKLGIREYVMKPFDKREMAETIRRVLDNKSVERREHERFKVKDGAISIPTSDFYKKGKIIDISKSGLAFCYKGNGDLSKEFTELAINISLKKFNLGNIPCRTISDLTFNDDSGLESGLMRRCSIQFGELDPTQTDQLDSLIENHTIAG